MPRKPKAPSKKAKASNSLIEALDFLSVVGKEKGTPYETHILLSNKTATAYNDQLAAGFLINEEIYCAPNTKIFHQALSKCTEGYTLTIDGPRMILKSGKFKASIPCIDPNLLSFRNPDPPCAQINDDLRTAFECMDIIKPEPDAQKIHLLAFLLNGQTVISTDGKILIEYWHGIDLPTNIAIPKALLSVVLANKKKLYSFGFSNTSVTFYFEDHSFVKSQLYADPWPMENVQEIFRRNCNVEPISEDFFKGLDAISGFSENGNVYFKKDLLCSNDAGSSATYEVMGLRAGPVYSAKYLSMARKYMEKVDFCVTERNGYMAYFFGKNVRGVVAGHG